MEGLIAVAALILALVLRSRLTRAAAAIDDLTARVDALERTEGRTAARSSAAAPVTQPLSIDAPAVARGEPAAAASGPGIGRHARPEAIRVRLDGRSTPGASTDPAGAPTPRAAGVVAPPALHPAEPSPIGAFTEWLFGGNTVVRVGVVVLFFGVAFFFNYAVEQGWLPIEVRLGLAMLGGLALTATGWRLRDRRVEYGIALQGGGVGVVYLSAFAAVNLYGVLPPAAGLGMMLLIVALSSALAVLQDARSLAVLATLGGLLAPVLVSRGGSHLALFSYYAVLDAGIFGIAWFKTWPWLNRLGFLGTFVVATAWGVLSYTPELFWTVEPFLLAFFLFYVAIPVLSAARSQQSGEPPPVDVMLVFGVPMVAFGLQAGVVGDVEHGLAWSAGAAALFYGGLSRALWDRLGLAGRRLAEIFVALAVTFGTVAVPLALDGRWTGGIWALEGAALVWLGVRDRRTLATLAGIVLQVIAGLFVVATASMPAGGTPVLNGGFLAAALVALMGLLSAWLLHRRAVSDWVGIVSPALLAWGLAWWSGAGLRELLLHVPAAHAAPAVLLFAAGTATAVAWLRGGCAWPHLAFPVVLLLPILLAGLGSFDTSTHPLAGLWSVAWMSGLAAHYWTMRHLEAEWPPELRGVWHQASLGLVIALASWETWWLVTRVAPAPSAWSMAAWVVMPAVALLTIPALVRRVHWPFRQFSRQYLDALLLVAGAAAGWILLASASPGSPAPLPYVPLVNPLEVTQALVLVVLVRWTRALDRAELRRATWYVWSVCAFAALNGAIARAVSVYGGVNFTIAALWDSALYQAAVSLVWTIAALGGMVSATWLTSRSLWFSGAAVLGAVVLKLFLVDLVDADTVARIVSFLGVGTLMLLVGYLSPLPPRREEPAS